jgi:cytochrome c-type biogenesis protein CcmF
MFAAAFILMGVAPLSAWGVTSLQRLGRSLLVPGMLTAIVLALIIANGLTHVVALMGYAVVSLAGFVAVYETFRGAAARRRRFGENWLQAVAVLARRNPRRYGGYMVHLGITVIGIGVIGSTLFQSETQRTLGVGESLEIENYQMRYDRLLENQVADDGRIMDIAEVTVLRDGKEVAQIRPRIDFFPNSRDMNTMTIAGAHSTIRNDFYVLLVSWDPVEQNQATFKVFVNPLINLVWGGGLILILGTAIAVWPKSSAPARVKHSASARDPLGVPA